MCSFIPVDAICNVHLLEREGGGERERQRETKYSICVAFTDPCNSSPCNNGGFCKKKKKEYACICKDGYTGNHCEIEY